MSNTATATIQLRPKDERPDYVIAGVCTACGFEGDATDFGWRAEGTEGQRLHCNRCGGAAWEIPYQSLVLSDGGLVALPGRHPEYNCENCDTKTKFGAMKVNGVRHFWCGTCSIAVANYARGCVAKFRPPEFREFLGVLQDSRDQISRRRVVIPGA